MRTWFLTVVTLLLWFVSPLHAQPLSVSIGKRQAELSYTIRGSFGRSHLEFPVNNIFFRGALSRSIDFPSVRSIDELRLKAGWSNLQDGSSGTSRDYDYLGNPDGQLDIYSEQDAYLAEGNVLDLQLELSLRDNLDYPLFFTAGYRYYHYRINTRNLDQEGYGSYSGYTTTADGLIITYERHTYFPFVGFRQRIPYSESTTISYQLRKSFWVHVRDRDDHHLRNKMSRGELEGRGTQLQVQAQFKRSGPSDVFLKGQYLTYSAQGHQDQHWYGPPNNAPINNIDQTVHSRELSVSAGFRYYW